MKIDYSFNNFKFFLIILIFISSTAAIRPQNPPQVSLTAARVDIQQWERITFKAALNYEDTGASYIFYINNEPNTIGVVNNELRDYEFRETGTFIIKVIVRSLNNILTDSLRINVRKVSLSVNPQEVFTNEKINFELGYQLPENYIKYRFHFGGNLPPSEWLDQSQTTYAYNRPDTYRVFAEIGKFDGETLYDSIQSEDKRVVVKIEPTYEVRLSEITHSTVDENITFIANATTNVPNLNFRYQFDFGDNTVTAPQSQNIVEHSYRKSDTYKASVKLLTMKDSLVAESNEVTITVQDSVDPHKKSVAKQVKDNPFDVRLFPSDASDRVGKEITFKAVAITNIAHPDFRFIFDFGDTNQTELQPENTATHRYDEEGKYTLTVRLATHRYDKEGKYTVTVRLLNTKGGVVAVNSSNIIIEPNIIKEQPVNILLYILLALFGLISGSLALKYLFKPKLKLQPKSDTGTQSVTKGKDTLIDLTVRINPNVNQAELHLDTSNKKIVDKIRRIK